MSGIRLKRHPEGRELKAPLDTLPLAARARWWRKNRRWVDAGEAGPPAHALLYAESEWPGGLPRGGDRTPHRPVLVRPSDFTSPARPGLKVIAGGKD